MSELQVLLEDVASARETLQGLLSEVRDTRLWQVRADLQGVGRASMNRFEVGMISIDALVSTLGWDHATLMVGAQVHRRLISPGTEEAIRNRVRFADDLILWLHDYLAWAARWKDDGLDDAEKRTLY
ncbi:hypothetical protein [Deinococcus yunweiensis]|uniref:hypothetical protein n=1 Tax=Deinococcus yunweiensis TaxID=367282 RepID=UPI00398E6708